MLYRMPAAAAAENWICDALNAALLDGFDRADAGEAPTAWPDCLPEAHRDALRRRGRLGEAVAGVITAYAALQPNERTELREARYDQMRPAELYAGELSAKRVQDLPAPLAAPLREYADCVFDALDDLGVRDRSFEIHGRTQGLACAFCGYEAADNARVRNMDWDHYLAKSLYPFAGANLLNFAPMGDACNRTFKSSKDILRSNAGARRRCFDPYASEPATVDLLDSTLFARGPGNLLPEWRIGIRGDADSCATWDAIFELSARWIDRLDRVHEGCLGKFGRLHRGRALTDADVVDGLDRLASMHREHETAAGEFLPAAVYELWSVRCAGAGEEAGRLLRLLRRLAEP